MSKYFHFLEPKLKWAIAGRSHSKLAAVKAELIAMGNSKSPLPDILIGDATDIRGMKDMFDTCHLVLNCAGPFKALGHDIIEACISARANYMDICGESLYMEKSFLEFHELAASKGVLVVHACGFDSVPVDIGSLFSMQQYPAQMCSSIESYLIIRCPEGLSAHYTAFESAVRNVGDSSKVKKLRKEIKQKYNIPATIEIGPKLKKRSKYYFNKQLKKYVLPFSGADSSVVRSSHRGISMLEGQVVWPQYHGYVAISSIYNVAATAFYKSVCSSLAGFSFGRSLLIQFPDIASGGVFNREGPTPKQLEKTTFEVHLFSKGYSVYLPELFPSSSRDELVETGKTHARKKDHADIAGNKNMKKESIDSSSIGQSISLASDVQPTAVMKKNCTPSVFDFNVNSIPLPVPPVDRDVHIVVSGPEPLYIATPIILVTLGICLLEERDLLPVGGVYTPAGAFHKSLTVIDRLDRAGISFTIAESKVHDNTDEYLDELLVVSSVTTGEGIDDNDEAPDNFLSEELEDQKSDQDDDSDSDASELQDTSQKANDTYEEIKKSLLMTCDIGELENIDLSSDNQPKDDREQDLIRTHPG